MSRLECGYVTEKFMSFSSTVSSESVRAYFERLRTNSVESGVGAEECSADCGARRIYEYGWLSAF
jgi:hypothetical protein